MLSDYAEAFDSFILANKQRAWDFALEIEGAPNELNILAKNISYEPVTINTGAKQIGSQQWNLIESTEAVSLTATLRDAFIIDGNKQRLVLYDFLKEWAGLEVNADGTFGIPAEYVKKVTIHHLAEKETDPDVYYMFLRNIGDRPQDRSSKELFEFPITLIEYSTNGINQAAFQ